MTLFPSRSYIARGISRLLNLLTLSTARTGDAEEFNSLKNDLCAREKIKFSELLEVAKDDVSGNGVLHMVSANGHDCKRAMLAAIPGDAIILWR